MSTKQKTRAHLILLAIAIILFNAQIFAQWDNPSLEMLTDDGIYKGSGLQAIDLDSYGNPHITWLSAENIGNVIKYITQDSDGEWGAVTTVVDTSIYYLSTPALAISPVDDKPYIVYYSEYDYAVYISYLNGTTWEREQVSEIYVYNYSPTIAIDDSGVIHLAWITWDESLEEYYVEYAFGTIGDWQKQTLWGSELGSFGSGAAPYIDIASDGVAHIAYRGGDYIDEPDYHIHHAWNDTSGGSQWQYEIVYTNNGNDNIGMLAIDSEDGIHFTMSGNDGWFGSTYSMYIYKSPDGTWGNAETVSETYNISFPSLALDSNDKPHVAGMGICVNIYMGDIYYAYKDDSGIWQCDSLYGNDHCYPSLKIDQSGNRKMFCLSGACTGIYDVCYLTGDSVTSIGDNHDSGKPISSYELLQNYPNPFNNQTLISYNLFKQSDVTIDIYDINGRRVETLVNGAQNSGLHQVIWNAEDISSGVYFYRITADGYSESEKMILLK